MNTDKSSAPAMYFWGTPNNYAVKPSPSCDLKNMPSFSIFRRPITNKHPYQVVNLIDVFNYIISDYAKDRTNELRTIKDDRYRRQFKADKFDYCTFSGIFSVRTDKAIIQHSGLICLDFDHLKDVEAIFEALKEDTYFEVTAKMVNPTAITKSVSLQASTITSSTITMLKLTAHAATCLVLASCLTTLLHT